MSYVIAVAGKGGTGKTTLSALMVRALKESGKGSVLAIDADPNSNLGEALGLEGASTIVEIIDSISKNPDLIPPGVTKDRYINMKIQESLDEEEGFDLLSMGRPEGPGCYCFANNMLRGLIKNLMDSYSYVVIDNEAGMEHLSRRLVRTIDLLVMVSDASAVGIRSAARITDLARELKIIVKNKAFILNKTKGSADPLKEETLKAKLELTLTLPFNEEIEEAALKAKSVFGFKRENLVLNSIRDLVNKKTEESVKTG